MVPYIQEKNSYHFSSTLSSFAAFCVWTNEYKRLDNISKHSTGTSYIHKFQNTTEISHSLVHRYKAPNHDKLLYLQICKNYHILGKFWPNKNTFGSVLKNRPIFSTKSSHSYIVFLKMWNFNQGKLLTTIRMSWNKNISWKFPFLNYHIKEYYYVYQLTL